MTSYYITKDHKAQQQVSEVQYTQWILGNEWVLRKSTTNDIKIVTFFNGVVTNPLLHLWYSTAVDGVIKNQYKNLENALIGHEDIVAAYRKKLIDSVEGLSHYAIIDVKITARESRHVIPLDKKILIEISPLNGIKILNPESKCGVCGGRGAQIYRYYEDEMHVALCYICNGGTKEEWERQKKNFDEFARSLR